MLTLPENNFYKALLWLASVIVTILYAWLASVTMAPSPVLPQGLIAGSASIIKGKAYKLEQSPEFRWLEYQRMGTELHALAGSIPLIGGLANALHLTINHDEPRVFKVSATQIEVGAELARARGQIAKAVLRAWLLQKGDAAFTNSLLRAEAVTDALVVVLGVVSDVESVGGEGYQLSRVGPANWMAYAGSVRDVCESRFAFADLHALCRKQLSVSQAGQSRQISALAFRPLLAEWLIGHFEAAPRLKRVGLLRAWADYLQKPSRSAAGMAERTSFSEIASLSAWRDRLREEVSDLLPQDFLKSSGVERKSEELLMKAMLSASSPVIFDSVVVQQADIVDASAHRVRSRAETSWPKVRFRAHVGASDAIAQAGLRLDADRGSLRITADELGQNIQISQLIWESCESPTLQDLVQLPVSTVRVLVIKNCTTTPADLASLEVSIQDFAKTNSALTFVLLRMEGVKLAMSKGYLLPQTKAIDTVGTGPSGGTAGDLDILGLRAARRQAQWGSSVTAFKANGVIDAVEWFRPTASPTLPN